MIFAIKPASKKEKPVIFRLLQPYVEELSHFPDDNPDYKDENGIYPCAYLDSYWQENGKYAYILYGDKKLAGFALVIKEGENWEMAEFYVLPEFRRHGLGSACALDIFRKHPGEWRIGFNKHNEASRAIWQGLAERLSKRDIFTGESDTSHDYIRFSV
jgi:predicted acetyltransferase